MAELEFSYAEKQGLLISLAEQVKDLDAAMDLVATLKDRAGLLLEKLIDLELSAAVPDENFTYWANHVVLQSRRDFALVQSQIARTIAALEPLVIMEFDE